MQSTTKKQHSQGFNIRQSKIKLGKLIWSSKLGEVYEGFYGDVKAAIRIVPLDNDRVNLEDLEKEVDKLCRLSSPNIALFLGASTSKDKMYICTEYSQSLVTYLTNTPRLSLTRRMQLALGGALGMLWLHCSRHTDGSTGTVHRHVKTSSFLVFEHEVVKVCDFGLSAYWMMAGTDDPYSQGWIAPEVRTKRTGFTLASDVYPFGLVLLHLLTLKDPGAAGTDPCAAIPSDTPLPLRGLITACLAEDPEARPDFGAIVAQLREIVLDLILPDPGAREWWSKAFGNKEAVTWNTFADAYVEVVPGTPEPSLAYLKELLAEPLPQDQQMEQQQQREERKGEEEQDQLNYYFQQGWQQQQQQMIMMMTTTTMMEEQQMQEQKMAMYVKMSRFGDLIDRLCGDTKDGWMDLGKLAQEYFAYPWFHGYLSENASVGFLGSCPEQGPFLVRFSASTARAFVVSYRVEASDIRHAKIMHREGKFVYDGREFDSLEDIIEENKKLFMYPVRHSHPHPTGLS